MLPTDDRPIEVRENLLLSVGYILTGLLFGAWVWWFLGEQRGIDYSRV